MNKLLYITVNSKPDKLSASKTVGIKRFEELLVDGTGYTEKEEAIEKSLKKIDDVIEDVWIK